MKLTDWANKQGISYLTAYRWFKSGKLPVSAYQSESGTIIVQEDGNDSASAEPMEKKMSSDGNVLSLFLKKTVEFSKNNSTIEDFAAFVISNFKLQTLDDKPKYSKNKPHPAEIQEYFKTFIPNKEKPVPNMFVPEKDFVDSLTEESLDLSTDNTFSSKSAMVNQIKQIAGTQTANAINVGLNSTLSFNQSPNLGASPFTMGDSLTPQHSTLTYSSSIDAPKEDLIKLDENAITTTISASVSASPPIFVKFTDKELELSNRLSTIEDQPKKRGRKPKNK